MTNAIPVEDRFWDKVDQSGGPDACWLWIASLQTNGYGQIGIDRRPHLAHRVAYEMMVGPIPDGLQLDHLCRERTCVNPKHLQPVTAQTNSLRSSSFCAQNATKSHCPAGHPLSGSNVWIVEKKPGHVQRYCRECRRQRCREYKQRRKECRLTSA